MCIRDSLITYAESHDEERLMFDVIKNGKNTQPNYNVRDLPIGLRRAELAEVFTFLVPGPKMMYMFSELGYDISIDNPCRICNKPALWNYRAVPERQRLYDITAALIHLKTDYPSTFNTSTFTYLLAGAAKRIVYTDSTMNANVIGNFDVVNQSIAPLFKNAGEYYEYFTGDTLVVTDPGMTINLAAGEYRIYTDVKLQQPVITLSINDMFEQTGLVYSVFPNPSNGSIHLQLGSAVQGDVTLKLIDISGRVQLQQTSSGNQFGDIIEVDASHLPKGVYAILLSANGLQKTNLVVIE